MSGQINMLPSNLLDTEQQISIALSVLADEVSQQKLQGQLLAWRPGEVVLAATSSMETADLVDVLEAVSGEPGEVILESCVLKIAIS